MEGKLVWKTGMAFEGLTGTGFAVPMDTILEHGGTNAGPTPMELILVGLGGCTAMDVISILEKQRQEVTSFEILLHADRASEHPKVFTDITLEYVLTGHTIDTEAAKKAVDLSENKYCSAMAMLRKTANIQTKLTIKEV